MFTAGSAPRHFLSDRDRTRPAQTLGNCEYSELLLPRLSGPVCPARPVPPACRLRMQQQLSPGRRLACTRCQPSGPFSTFRKRDSTVSTQTTCRKGRGSVLTDCSDFGFRFKAPKDGESKQKQAGLFQGLTGSPY
ncbi:hypothetical protein HJG60_009279 [Phyllostomus discolor]|uniref:Uncharacterized protein n=1 Tax=Phyllostomus discolor TaxID=89673 RepID=A0A834DF86_9CHIR|nr:hypothetical protein HJG60_009279 [Phyllostomus discolor]